MINYTKFIINKINMKLNFNLPANKKLTFETKTLNITTFNSCNFSFETQLELYNV